MQKKNLKKLEKEKQSISVAKTTSELYLELFF